jgi:hypothetical protein
LRLGAGMRMQENGGAGKARRSECEPGGKGIAQEPVINCNFRLCELNLRR